MRPYRAEGSVLRRSNDPDRRSIGRNHPGTPSWLPRKPHRICVDSPHPCVSIGRRRAHPVRPARYDDAPNLHYQGPNYGEPVHLTKLRFRDSPRRQGIERRSLPPHDPHSWTGAVRVPAGQALDSFQEHLKAAGTVPSRKVVRHAPCPQAFLKLEDLFRNRLGRPDDGVWISVSRPSQLAEQGSSSSRERLHEGFRVTDVPGFELPADHPDERVGTSPVPAKLDQPRLDLATIRTVLIPGHHETHARLTPGPQLPGDALFQILLPVVRDALKPKRGKEPRQESVEQVRHRGFFHQKDELRHCGSAPSNSRCFQSAPGRSPSSTRSRRSRLSLPRRTTENPSTFCSQ